MKTSQVDLNGVIYINALNEHSSTAIALGILLKHTCTGEEKTIDLLVEDDRLGTVLRAIREHFNSYWGFVESWEIEPLQPLVDAA